MRCARAPESTQFLEFPSATFFATVCTISKDSTDNPTQQDRGNTRVFCVLVLTNNLTKAKPPLILHQCFSICFIHMKKSLEFNIFRMTQTYW